MTVNPNTDPAKATRRAYEANVVYRIDTVCRQESTRSDSYADRLLHQKLEVVRRHRRPGLLIDLCCATGDHIFNLSSHGDPGLGIDFSIPFLQSAQRKRAQLRLSSVVFAAADARRLPVASECAATLYSLSALYQIPNIELVLREIARVLQPRGRCVLDFGNARSINSFCVRRYYPEFPASFPIPVSRMRDLCAANGLRIIEHRAFQLLPLWAGRPWWLRPLLHPLWARLLAKRVAGRMLDDWISNLPIVKLFAFRHVIVCEKREACASAPTSAKVT